MGKTNPAKEPQSCSKLSKVNRNPRSNTRQKDERPVDGLPPKKTANGVGSLGKLSDHES